MTVPSFQNVVDDAAVLFLETHQMQDNRFEEWEYQRWDTADQFASLEFHFAGHSSKHSDTAFLGTAAPGPQSFLWAWANPHVEASPAQQAVLDQILDFGKHHRIPELTTGEVPFTAIVPAYADDEVRHNGAKGGATLVAFKIAAAALLITGRPNHFTADIGRGSMAVVTYNHDSLQLGPASALTFQMRLMEGISGLMIEDHRRAVESYARFRLGRPVTDVSPGVVELTFDDGKVTIDFDEANRVANLHASLGGGK
ncbi:DUF6882 domain-containing protein [Paenarthrobacter sp. NPDC090520]|uniref:DUF6882 domain-containing protein n=1 Tax=Paenarthrobacter sp. NPDC090520 TaxID=3364382 RepID=UPI0038180133